jgi:hypothetical protein
MLLSYPVRGGEPVVEALKVGALPEGGLKELLKMWGLRVAPNASKVWMRPRAGY